MWEQVADRLAGRAVVAKVDATEDLEFAEEYGVRGFPALKLFKRGRPKPVDYDGERDLDSLVRFVEAWLGDCPRILTLQLLICCHSICGGTGFWWIYWRSVLEMCGVCFFFP